MDIFVNRPGASSEPNHSCCGYEAKQSCRQSVNQQEILFAGRSAVAGKSEKKTQRRIDSFCFRFFLPPPMTVKEFEKQVMDSQQQPSRHRQRDSRKKQILSPNLTTYQLRSRTNQTPNQDGTFWAWVSVHRARSFRFPKRQFGQSKLIFRSFQVA